MGSVACNSAIGTVVERSTRYVMLLHLPDGHGADAVAHAMVEAMGRLPDTLHLLTDTPWHQRVKSGAWPAP
jgi:transposase, IS30 family